MIDPDRLEPEEQKTLRELTEKATVPKSEICRRNGKLGGRPSKDPEAYEAAKALIRDGWRGVEAYSKLVGAYPNTKLGKCNIYSLTHNMERRGEI